MSHIVLRFSSSPLETIIATKYTVSASFNLFFRPPRADWLLSVSQSGYRAYADGVNESINFSGNSKSQSQHLR
jgi:hypothetical protein